MLRAGRFWWHAGGAYVFSAKGVTFERPGTGMSARRRIGGIVVVVVVVAAVLLWRNLSSGATAAFTVVQPSDVLQTVLANGRVAGNRVVPLSMQRSGVVARIPAREGTMVRMGDTLLVLENNDYLNDISRQRAAVELAQVQILKLGGSDLLQAREQRRQAQVTAEDAERRLKRLETLLAEGAVARQDVDAARKEYDLSISQLSISQSKEETLTSTEQRQLQLQYAQARSALVDAQIALSRSVLQAPEDGKVLRMHVNRGQLVTVGAVAASFLPADTTTHIEIQVDESEIGRIRAGQRAIVALPSAPESTFEATVRDIVPIVDATKGTATVQLSLTELRERLLPDQTVTAQIVIDTIRNALVLEQRFITFSGAKASVAVLRGGKAMLAPVAVARAGGAKFVVESGLSAGDTALFAATLNDGQRVKPLSR
jgi:multidrug efflux pump subunit AcrA (membrane-fusion protein)